MPDEIKIQMRCGSTAVERIITPEMQQRSAEDLDALVQVLALKLLRDLQANRALQRRTQ